VGLSLGWGVFSYFSARRCFSFFGRWFLCFSCKFPNPGEGEDELELHMVGRFVFFNEVFPMRVFELRIRFRFEVSLSLL